VRNLLFIIKQVYHNARFKKIKESLLSVSRAFFPDSFIIIIIIIIIIIFYFFTPDALPSPITKQRETGLNM
jgi:hypothetical protein